MDERRAPSRAIIIAQINATERNAIVELPSFRRRQNKPAAGFLGSGGAGGFGCSRLDFIELLRRLRLPARLSSTRSSHLVILNSVKTFELRFENSSRFAAGAAAAVNAATSAAGPAALQTRYKRGPLKANGNERASFCCFVWGFRKKKDSADQGRRADRIRTHFIIPV